MKDSAVKSKSCWHFYVIRTVDNYLYAGITTDVKRRFREHTEGKGAKFLSAHKAQRIELSISVGEKGLALRVERRFKSLSKTEKELLIFKEKLFIDPQTGHLKDNDEFTTCDGKSKEKIP